MSIVEKNSLTIGQRREASGAGPANSGGRDRIIETAQGRGGSPVRAHRQLVTANARVEYHANIVVAIDECYLERRRAFVVLDAWITIGRAEQQRHNVRVAVLGRAHQRRRAIVVLQIDGRLALHQQAAYDQLAVTGRQHQGRLSILGMKCLH